MEFKKSVLQDVEAKYIDMLNGNTLNPFSKEPKIISTEAYKNEREKLNNRLLNEKNEYNKALNRIIDTRDRRIAREKAKAKQAAFDKSQRSVSMSWFVALLAILIVAVSIVFVPLMVFRFIHYGWVIAIFCVYSVVLIVGGIVNFVKAKKEGGRLAYHALRRGIMLTAGTALVLAVFIIGMNSLASHQIVINSNEDFAYFKNAPKSSIINVIISNDVEMFEEGVLEGCEALESISLPARGSDFKKMFNGNVPFSLKTVNITGGTSVFHGSFADCSSLESITIPASVTKISDLAFYECSSLKEVIFEEGSQCASIGEWAFLRCSSLESITIPSSITKIDKSAFGGCSSLKSINIPSGVTVIESSAFSGCASLERVTIPNSVTEISNGAFNWCTAIKEVIFEEGSQCASIGEEAFRGCSSLESITIPESVTSMGERVFCYCSAMRYLSIPIEYYSNLGYLFDYEVKLLFDASREYKFYIPDSLEEVVIGGVSKYY